MAQPVQGSSQGSQGPLVEAPAAHPRAMAAPVGEQTAAGEPAAAAGGSAAAAAAVPSLPAEGGTHPSPELAVAAGGSGDASKVLVRKRDQFAEVWTRFMLSRNLDASPAMFNRAAMDLYKLFRTVMKAGGFEAVLAQKGWARIGRTFNPPSSMTDLSYQVKKIYNAKLLEFEQAYTAGEINATIALDTATTASTTSTAEVAAKSKQAKQLQLKQQQQEVEQPPAHAAEPGVLPSIISPHPRPASRSRSHRRVKAGGKPSVSAGQAAPEAPSTDRSPSAAAPDAAAAEAAAGALHAAIAAAARPEAMPTAAAPALSRPLCQPSVTAVRPPNRRDGAAAAAAGVADGDVALQSTSRMARVHFKQRPALRATRPAAVASPDDLVGRRIGIWWGDDDTFYYGTVTAHDPRSGEHTVLYDDNKQESVHLAFEHWVFADGQAAPSPTPSQPPQQQQQWQQQQAPPSQQQQLLLAMASRAGTGPGLCSHHLPPQPSAALGGMLEAVMGGSPAAEAAGLPAPKRARTTVIVHQPPAPAPGLELMPAEQGAGRAGPLTAAAPLAPYQALQQQQPPQQQQYYELGSLAGLHMGMPVLAGSGSGISTSQPAGLQLGPAAAPPLHLYPPLPVPAPASLPVMHPPAAALEPVHQQPQELVAAGRNYRAFTASAPPAGFEIFVLMPGLSLDEINVRCWINGQVRISGEPRHGAAPGLAGIGWAAPTSSETIQLPARIDTASARALFTAAGQLYMRVDRLQHQ